MYAACYHGALHAVRLTLYRQWRARGATMRQAYIWACAYVGPRT